MRRHARARRRNVVQKQPQLFFTLEQLVLLRKALHPLEQMILTHTEPHPQTQFALATVTQVQAKINHMITQGIWGEKVGFDENELVILRSAVWIFLAALDALSPSIEKETFQTQYQIISFLLAPSQTQPSKSRY